MENITCRHGWSSVIDYPGLDLVNIDQLLTDRQTDIALVLVKSLSTYKFQNSSSLIESQY